MVYHACLYRMSMAHMCLWLPSWIKLMAAADLYMPAHMPARMSVHTNDGLHIIGILLGRVWRHVYTSVYGCTWTCAVDVCRTLGCA